jgi:hypothetical protein
LATIIINVVIVVVFVFVIVTVVMVVVWHGVQGGMVIAGSFMTFAGVVAYKYFFFKVWTHSLNTSLSLMWMSHG